MVASEFGIHQLQLTCERKLRNSFKFSARDLNMESGLGVGHLT